MAGPIESLLTWANDRPDLPPVGYRIRTIHWILSITRTGVRVLPYSRTDAVPTMRRSGTRPMPLLAVDTAAYVLGATGKGPTAEPATARAGAFWRQMGQWAATYPDHPAVGAAVSLLHIHGTAVSAGEIPPGDRVAIQVEGIWLHRLPEAVEHWQTLLTSAKGGTEGLCIGCRRTRPLATSLPNAIPAHLVPGAEHEVQLAVLPMAERTGGHLPVCVPCGDRAAMALQTMLEDRDRTIRLTGQHSTTTVFGIGTAAADSAAVALIRKVAQ